MRFNIDSQLLTAIVHVLNKIPAENSRPVLNAIDDKNLCHPIEDVADKIEEK